MSTLHKKVILNLSLFSSSNCSVNKFVKWSSTSPYILSIKEREEIMHVQQVICTKSIKMSITTSTTLIPIETFIIKTRQTKVSSIDNTYIRPCKTAFFHLLLFHRSLPYYDVTYINRFNWVHYTNALGLSIKKTRNYYNK